MKRAVLIAIAGVAVLIAAWILAALTFEGDSADDAQETSPPAAEAPATPGTTATEEADAADSPAERAPSFDVVRIDPQGNTVIAGRAAPGAEVVILDDGSEIGRVTADDRGEWVFLPDKPLEPGSRQLGLRAETKGVVRESNDVVVLVVPEHGADEQTLAVRSDRDGGGSRVLQGPLKPVGDGDLVVDSVDYDDTGKLSVSGRTEPGGTVQLYMDNAFIGRATAGDDGYWSIEPEQPASEGSHALRADLMAGDGKVRARVEMPFDRVELAGMPQGQRVVVQPGNSLWLLARRAYGEGTAYTVIFDANRGQIINPDLIYPGQVFVVPEGGGPLRPLKPAR